MAAKKRGPNWAKIKADYEGGEASVREIARRHKVSDTAVHKRAKVCSWVRTHASKPAPPRAAQLLLPSPAGVAVAPPADPPEPADAGALADQGRALIGRMLDELDTVTSNVGELEDLIELETHDDRDDKRRQAMLRAIQLPARAMTMNKLAGALKTLNEASAPQGKKAAQQDKANEIANRFRGVGPPTLKAVK